MTWRRRNEQSNLRIVAEALTTLLYEALWLDDSDTPQHRSFHRTPAGAHAALQRAITRGIASGTYEADELLIPSPYDAWAQGGPTRWWAGPVLGHTLEITVYEVEE